MIACTSVNSRESLMAAALAMADAAFAVVQTP